MEFEKIPNILKRYKFEAIMQICTDYSLKLMIPSGLDIQNSENIYPWELETFALLGLMSVKKNDSHDFDSLYHRRKFFKIITCLREYIHPKLKLEDPDSTWTTRFLMVTGAIQFPSQENISYKLYRYSYIFNFRNSKLNLQEIFKDTFGVDYSEFQKPGQALYILLSLKKVDPKLVHHSITHIVNKHATALRQLIISRDEFVKKQENILDGNIDNYYYSFKYFFQYPFIEFEDKIYLPLPYLIINAITDSLLFRITENNNSIRSKIGKEAIETYLVKILYESNAYDEVFSEQSYKKGRNNLLSSDALARVGSCGLLFDSKSSVPRVTLRNLDEKSIASAIDIYSNAIVQLYKRSKDFKLYNPFTNHITFAEKDIFGIVVVLEDNYITRELIYADASEKLNLIKESPEWMYLRSNFTILPLKDIESTALNSANIQSGLINKRDSRNKWNDFSLDFFDSDTIYSHTKEFENFASKSKETIHEVAQDLVDSGIIK